MGRGMRAGKKQKAPAMNQKQQMAQMQALQRQMDEIYLESPNEKSGLAVLLSILPFVFVRQSNFGQRRFLLSWGRRLTTDRKSVV